MGKVIEKIKLTNLLDLMKTREVDAVIDTGATMLVLPENVVEELGLRKIGERRVRYANNQIQIKSVYRGVILELKGRDGIFDVLGEVEGSEPLVGQIVLEALDLVVDPITKTVIPNPKSPDMPLTEILMGAYAHSALPLENKVTDYGSRITDYRLGNLYRELARYNPHLFLGFKKKPLFWDKL